MPVELLELTPYVLGVVVGFVLGLYLGERGRRLDLQWQRGKLRAKDRAAVKIQTAATPEAEAMPIVDAAGRESLILDLMRTPGATRPQAEREADRLLGEHNKLGGMSI